MLLYNKVKKYLLEEIEKKEEGSILPSQNFLSRKLNVCHLTVRRALEELEKEGLIINRYFNLEKCGVACFEKKEIKNSP